MNIPHASYAQIQLGYWGHDLQKVNSREMSTKVEQYFKFRKKKLIFE